MHDSSLEIVYFSLIILVIFNVNSLSASNVKLMTFSDFEYVSICATI